MKYPIKYLNFDFELTWRERNSARRPSRRSVWHPCGEPRRILRFWRSRPRVLTMKMTKRHRRNTDGQRNVLIRLFRPKQSKANMKLLLICFLLRISVISAATCERLQQSLTYTQEEAPRDLSGVVSLKFKLLVGIRRLLDMYMTSDSCFKFCVASGSRRTSQPSSRGSCGR